MDSGREVVITGLGVVSPIGIGADAFWASLRAARSGVRRIESLAQTDFPVPIGADVVGFEGKDFVQPRKALKVMCREIQMGFAAAVLAMKDASLVGGQVEPDRFGVVYGSEMFYVELKEQEAAYRASVVDGEFSMQAWGEKGMSMLYPLWMLQYLPNMVGCHVAITYDARGPNNTIVLGDASALLALSEAASAIERGHADVMLVGGVGNRLNPTPLIYRRDLLLSHRVDQPEGAPRPFDATRDGTVNGEGAAVVILESREHAARRQARILARVLGSASGFEAAGPTGQRSGAAVRQTIGRALTSANIAPTAISHVKAHGIATVHDDAAEAQAIHAVFGSTPVTAPKSLFGNLGAGGGLIELAASVLALHHNEVPPTRNYSVADPACPITVVHGEPLAAPQTASLVLHQSGTGQAAAIVLGKEP